MKEDRYDLLKPEVLTGYLRRVITKTDYSVLLIPLYNCHVHSLINRIYQRSFKILFFNGGIHTQLFNIKMYARNDCE